MRQTLNYMYISVSKIFELLLHHGSRPCAKPFIIKYELDLHKFNFDHFCQFQEEGQLARPTVISELLANPAHMLSLWFAPREGNSNGLVVVVKAVVTRNKPKKIPSHCKKLENNIFVVTPFRLCSFAFFRKSS